MLFELMLMLHAHFFNSTHGKSKVDTGFSVILAKELNAVQTWVLVEPDTDHRARRHSVTQSEGVVNLVTSDETLNLALRGVVRLMLTLIKVMLTLKVHFQDLNHRNDQVLINKLLGQLYLDVKLIHMLYIFQEKVLVVEEWVLRIVIIMSCFKGLNLLSLRPGLVLPKNDWGLERSKLGPLVLTAIKIGQSSEFNFNKEL